MKKLGVKFGLKAGKSYTLTMQSAFFGKKKIKWKLTNIKITDAEAEGYNKLTCVATFRDNFRPTAAQVDKGYARFYGKYNGTAAGISHVFVVDGKSGLSLATDNRNNFDVTVAWEKTPKSKRKIFYGTNGRYVEFNTIYQTKMMVIYPKTYKDLCIGFGGGQL